MTEYEAAALGVQYWQVMLGVAQCALIGLGIWVMSGSNKNREANNAALIGMGAALQSQSAGIQELLTRTER